MNKLMNKMLAVMVGFAMENIFQLHLCRNKRFKVKKLNVHKNCEILQNVAFS